MSKDEEAELRKEISKKEATLQMYEKILNGDATALQTPEQIRAETKENLDYLEKIKGTMQEFFKVRDDVMYGEQITARIKKYQKAIKNEQDSCNKFKATTEKTKAKLSKLKTQKLPKQLVNDLKPPIHELKVQLKSLKADIQGMLLTDQNRRTLQKKVKKAFVQTIIDAEDADAKEVQKLKTKYRKMRKSKKMLIPQINDDCQQYAKFYIKKFRKIIQKTHDQLDQVEQKIHTLNKKIKTVSKKLNQIQQEKIEKGKEINEENEQQPTDKLEILISERRAEIKQQFYEAKKKAEEDLKEKQRQEIQTIRKEVEIPESSEENGEHFSESDKKKRYLLALRHVEKHMKEYQSIYKRYHSTFPRTSPITTDKINSHTLVCSQPMNDFLKGRELDGEKTPLS